MDNEGNEERQKIGKRSSVVNYSDEEEKDNDDNSMVSNFKASKRMVVNGVQLDREQQQRIGICLINQLDKPTVNKLAAKCSFRRINPGPVKFDMKQIELRRNSPLEGNYNEDPSGFSASWETMKPMFQVLTKLFQFTEMNKPRSCIEIGSGLGILGIFFRKLMSKQLCRVDLLDFEQDLVQLIRFNVLFNGLGDRVQIQNMDLQGLEQNRFMLNSDGYNLILASDFLLSATKGVMLAMAIKALLHDGIALVSHRMMFNCSHDKYFKTMYSNEPQDSALQAFTEQCERSDMHVHEAFSPDMGDVKVFFVTKDAKLMQDYIDFFEHATKEGFVQETVGNQVSENMDVNIVKNPSTGMIDISEFVSKN